MAADPRARAYFDARALPFDRQYDRRPGLQGRFEAWVYRPLRTIFELTLKELGDLEGKSLLDVGCGPGRYAVAAAERGADVVGIDLSPKMLSFARQRAASSGVSDRCRFVEADFDAYRPEVRFDIVLMIGLLEYRARPQRDVARLRELAREKAILQVPAPRSWRTSARRLRHGLRATPPTLHVHTPEAIAACLEQAGLGSWRSERGWFVVDLDE